VGGHHCSVSRKGQSQGFVEAVHGVGGEHTGAGAAGRAGVFFHNGQFFIGHIGIRSHNHGIHQIQLFIPGDTRFHGATGNKNCRNIQSHGGHEHSWSDFIAVRNTDQSVRLVSIHHVLHGVSDDLPGRKGIQHSPVPHGDPIIHGDGVKLSGETTSAFNDFFHLLSDVLKVSVSWYKLSEGISDGNNGFSKLIGFYTVGSPQSSGSGHISSKGGSETS